MAERYGSGDGDPALSGWFDNHRLVGPIGHIPPAEAEANYYAASETLDMVS